MTGFGHDDDLLFSFSLSCKVSRSLFAVSARTTGMIEFFFFFPEVSEELSGSNEQPASVR